MIAIRILSAMALFAIGTARAGRRRGNGIARHPYNDLYSDATAARTPLPRD
jgi:predicted GNAT superfamily acetyltransferase